MQSDLSVWFCLLNSFSIQIAFTAWAQRREARRLHRKIQPILDSYIPKPSSERSPTPSQKSDGVGDNKVISDKEHSSRTKNIHKSDHVAGAEPDLERGVTDRDSHQPANHHQDEDDRIERSVPKCTSTQAESVKSRAFETPRRRHKWTRTHSFYVISGGFVYDTSDFPEDEKFLPGKRERVTLSPNGAEYLTEKHPEFIPDIPEATIKDKSKANALAKTLVCLQAIWFILQCIIRLAEGLSISLLELNTFAHSLCALLIYCLWWNKPLDIDEPNTIRDKRIQKVFAGFCTSSRFDGSVDTDVIEMLPKESWQSAETAKTPENTKLPSEPIWLEQGMILPYTSGRCRVRKGTNSVASETFQKLIQNYQGGQFFRHDVWRWILASTGPNDLPRNAVYERAKNWPSDFNFSVFNDMFVPEDFRAYTTSSDGLILLCAYTVSGLAYGSLHLVAWKFPFTSHVQELLWRISGLAIASSGPGFIILSIVVWPFTYTFRKSPSGHIIERFSLLVITGVYFLYLLFYVVARAYLVVECFISLAYLPDVVFQQPRWTSYFPHIS